MQKTGPSIVKALVVAQILVASFSVGRFVNFSP